VCGEATAEHDENSRGRENPCDHESLDFTGSGGSGGPTLPEGVVLIEEKRVLSSDPRRPLDLRNECR